jgi:hypothetical protein
MCGSRRDAWHLQDAKPVVRTARQDDGTFGSSWVRASTYTRAYHEAPKGLQVKRPTIVPLVPPNGGANDL